MNVQVFDQVLDEDFFQLLEKEEETSNSSSSSSSNKTPALIGSIDQGTLSTRFLVLTQCGRIAALAQIEHEQLYIPNQPGWHEQNPFELFAQTKACIMAVGDALLQQRGIDLSSWSGTTRLAAVGITNQRETTIVWNAETGIPYYNAIVWDDTRTQRVAQDIAAVDGGGGDLDRFRWQTGLPLSSYFAGTKVKWLLDNVPALGQDLKDPVKRKQVRFGTVDTWLIYQLTGTPAPDHNKRAMNTGGLFFTDVTNASRWLFMDLHKVQWDQNLVNDICAPHSLPVQTCLPKICPSSHIFGVCRADSGVDYLHGVPLAAVVGDQQAALVGQAAFLPGEAKNTYGTDLFLMMNTGTKIGKSKRLLATIAYQMGPKEPVIYALEGSVSHSGSTIQWLRDQLQIIPSAPDSEALATLRNDGLYFVPAFCGLFAPHWRSDARACLVGLTTFHHKGHVCRAALESAAYHTREVFDAIEGDSHVQLQLLKVDGGGSANNLMMQFQADILNVPVVKPVIQETTALGAAFCAGLAVGVWEHLDEIRGLRDSSKTYQPQMTQLERQNNWNGWNKAVSRSVGWMDPETGKKKTDLLAADDDDDDSFGWWWLGRPSTTSVLVCSAVGLAVGAWMGTGVEQRGRFLQ